MTLKFALFGWLCALAATVTLEQLLCGLVRWQRLRRDPMVSDNHETAFYQRTLFTFASREIRWLWLGLLTTATLAWLAWVAHPIWAASALAALVGCGVWDLSVWECVAVSRWQVAWRRGWRRSVRRVPTAQIAKVHVVERPLSRGTGWLARQHGQALGTCYLALELHNGRAVKLPRTGRWSGRKAVEFASAFLRQRQRETRQARRVDARERQRAARRARRLMPDASELQLKREIAALREARSRNERQRAMTVYHDLPPPDSRLPTGDTLMLS